MTPRTHREIAEHLIDYVLGETSPDDTRAIEGHVRECAECGDELAALRETLADLAATSEPRTPDPTLRRRVMAAVARAADDTPRSRRDAAAHRPSRALRAAFAGGVLAIGVLAAWLVVAIDRSHAARDAEQQARREVAQLRERVTGYAEQTDLALAILAATDMRERSLTGGPGTGASGARAFWSPTRGLLVVVDRLPAPPVNRVYQVWVIAGATPVSAGLLATPADGPRMLIAPPPREGLAGGVTIAVTDEPPGGLRAPSGTIHLSGAL